MYKVYCNINCLERGKVLTNKIFPEDHIENTIRICEYIVYTSQNKYCFVERYGSLHPEDFFAT